MKIVDGLEHIRKLRAMIRSIVIAFASCSKNDDNKKCFDNLTLLINTERTVPLKDLKI